MAFFTVAQDTYQASIQTTLDARASMEAVVIDSRTGRQVLIVRIGRGRRCRLRGPLLTALGIHRRIVIPLAEVPSLARLQGRCPVIRALAAIASTARSLLPNSIDQTQAELLEDVVRFAA
jgi:hypothetical protein